MRDLITKFVIFGVTYIMTAVEGFRPPTSTLIEDAIRRMKKFKCACTDDYCPLGQNYCISNEDVGCFIMADYSNKELIVKRGCGFDEEKQMMTCRGPGNEQWKKMGVAVDCCRTEMCNDRPTEVKLKPKPKPREKQEQRKKNKKVDSLNKNHDKGWIPMGVGLVIGIPFIIGVIVSTTIFCVCKPGSKNRQSISLNNERSKATGNKCWPRYGKKRDNKSAVVIINSL